MIPRLAIATGTRAEYGIFRPLLRAFQSRGWPCELYVTGMHLAPQYGLTVREIEADGFPITERVELLLSGDTPEAICKSLGLATISFGELFVRRRPELLFILGDRFEAFAIATAAQVAGIPIAHIHGGESTEGLIDEAFRHSITKMSQLHFVATDIYRDRVIQLGEAPATVHRVGALGLDNIATVDWIERATLERDLDFQFRDRNILVTQHPLTLDLQRSRTDFDALLAALDQFDDLGILITAPNADTGGEAINRMISDFARRAPDRIRVVASLGTRRYFSVLKYIDAVVGNSSSGLIEVPSFGIPTVNIGDRQKGRIAGGSVIATPADAASLAGAIRRALSPDFRAGIADLPNPYGRGQTAQAICEIVAGLRFPLSLQKPFYDLPPCASSS